MNISDWFKKYVVQPVTQTISSWFTPAITKKTPTSTVKSVTPAVSNITSPWTTVKSKSPGLPSKAYTPQPTEADYLKRKAEAEAVISYLRAPPTQGYVPGKGYVPYQSGMVPSYQEQLDRVAAMKKQYSWLGTGEEVKAGTAAGITPTALTGMYTPSQIEQVQSQPNILDTIKSWFTPQQPAPAESWTSAKDVFGQSQQGQSLLSSIQGWMGKAGQVFQTPFTPSAVQAQGETAPVTPPTTPAETPSGKGFTPAEWERMGRPLGGAYAGWGGVPTTGLELAKTAISPEKKYWWEGGTMMGAPTSEQLNTPEYITGYFKTLLDSKAHPELYDGKILNAEGEEVSENFWDAFTSDAKEGYYTPEQISRDPKIHEALVSEMLMRDKYDQKWFETLKGDNAANVVVQVASQDPEKLPPTISQEYLDSVERGPAFATLYDYGYRSQAYQEEVTAGIQQVQSTGAQVIYDPESLNSLTYANIEGLKQELTQISPAKWQTIIENNGQITLKTEFWKFNAKGEPVNKGSWDIDYPPQSEMKQSEKDRYIDQQRFYNEWYWSDESVEQRRREREDNYEYYQEKENEGWAEYYDILDSMKLYSDANDFWSQPGKFAELRRKWETSDSGLTWEAWLQQFDFEGEWYAKPPTERGERPYVYSPRMIRLNY